MSMTVIVAAASGGALVGIGATALALPTVYRRGWQACVAAYERVERQVRAELEQRVVDAAPVRQSPSRRRSRPDDLTQILPRPIADPWQPDFDKTALIPRYNPERPQ